MDIKSLIRDIPDFPQQGILFRDITTLLSHSEGLQYVIDAVAEQCAPLAIDYIIGIESRGFIFGMPLAYKMGLGFIPVRKRGKLPAAVYKAEYALEYGTDQVEMHQDAMPAGSRALIVDDLIATGGTATAAAKLVDQADCQLAGFAFIIELLFLEGRKNLPEVPVISLLQY
jgi:adenine phosphoribosyltransferase